MGVLPGLVQYLQCLSEGLSAAICCHPGALSSSSNHEIIISNDLSKQACPVINTDA